MKALVVGCGSIGRRHTENLRRLGVEEILAFDPDRSRSTSAASEYGVQAVETLDAGYDQEPQIVLICAPTSLHLELAYQALEHRCHVFVEKPLSHQLDGTESLIASARERGRVLMVGYNLRFHSCVCKMRGWLEEKRIGHVASARLHAGSYLPARHPWEDYRCGYGAKKNLGGGVILDSIHEIDYALLFFGMPETVNCLAGKFSNLEIDVEDVAEILLDYPDRKVVSIHLDYLDRPPQRYAEIIGDGGVIRSNLVDSTAQLFEGEKNEWTRFRSRGGLNDAYVSEMKHFLECVSNATTPLVDGEAACRSLAVAEAAKRSAREHHPVTLLSHRVATT
ncbi:MAG TPA: Gfo/Idh/MocA family oxidoreductase [Terriglobia bacterium]|nr:Gfo/Idh/MocA family oxidoreductase [Terriglobia bacterium]